jgi:hypothetical protein
MKQTDTDQIVATLKEIVEDAAPDVRFLPKYGGEVMAPFQDNDKKFVGGVFAYKDHVTMEFSEGATFSDPEGLLQGKGKNRRHLKFESVQDIRTNVIEEFLRQALE